MRTALVAHARSLFDRGFAVGSAGNISVKLADGTFLATPTGSSFGRLREEEVSHFTKDGTLLGGKEPTKEIFFHLACYETRPKVTAVVHLHSTYATLLSSIEGISDGMPFAPFTPYFVMQVGSVGILPYRKPGDPAIANDVRKKAEHTTLLLANHGLIVCRESLDRAVDAAEEFEETAKLWYLSQGLPVRPFTDSEIAELRT